ncbi:hypothetical protein, partial [Sinorhizobium meliloti]|uniref:hypothetical protein n=1 Tax=Rhizobium meliloti TaxID=382 RepID=UPI001AECA1E6
MAFHRSPFVASGNPVFMQLEETASLFHNADYLITWCSRVHSISKCDMPMISMGSPWRFWNVPTLFAAESD